MSLAAKRRLVAIVIAVLAVWPLGHRVMVTRHGVTPWRFFGWAMYCLPKLPVRISVQAVSADARTRLAITGADNQALRRAVRRFSHRRGIWGDLVQPDGIGALALAAHPGSDRIEVEVEHLFLDPDTARIDSSRSTYTYTRPQEPALAPNR